MKTLLTVLLFTALSLHASAQSTFTEKTLTDMRQRMLSTNWEKFSKAEVSPDFVMQGNAGKPCDMTCMEALNNSSKLVEWPMEQIKIRQVGNVAIVTGITHHSAVNKKTNAKWTANERFTETYMYKNGKWLWMTAHYTSIQPPVDDEKAAVQKAIENESYQFHHNADRNVFLSSWSMAEGTMMCYSGKAAQITLMGKDMKAAAENGTIPKASNENTTFANYVIRVNGNTAWATFDQTGAAGNVTHEFRLMEKIGNDWKIVSSSVHDTAK